MRPAPQVIRQPADAGGLIPFKDKHKGEHIIVCGCGTSATLAPVGQAVIIGVNDIGRLFTPNYLVVLNDKASFKPGRWEWIQSSNADYCFTQYHNLDTKAKKVLIKLGHYGDPNPAGPAIGYTSNSPYVGCVLAAYMGASKIGLLGVDFTEDHFFGKTGVHTLNRRLPQIMKEYTEMTTAYSALGIELVNLSPISKLDIPRMDVSGFLGTR